MKLVLDMQDRRSVWAMPAWVPERIRAAIPSDWSLQVMDEPADGSGDGSARVSPSVLAAVMSSAAMRMRSRVVMRGSGGRPGAGSPMRGLL